MQFLMFHLMPWPYLPEDFETRERSAWVTLSNATYDPVKGRELYTRYIDELVYAEELGFDGICVNEHHQTAYGLMPSPNVIAGMLVQRTSRAKIAVLGNAIPLRDHPLRVAEEIAMLDVISGGRLICGFVRGIGPEYHSLAMNPTDSRSRFLEAHDLIVKCWTEPGPINWQGEHYKLLYANPWPRPLQQPHPPVWIPSQGSGETIEWAAGLRYTFLLTFTQVKNVERYAAAYRAAARAAGYQARPEQVGWSMPIYVGETDAAAAEEARRPVEYLFNTLLKRPPSVFFPPGYLSESSMKAVLASHGALGVGRTSFDELNASGQIVVGSPDTVARRLSEYVDRTGVGVLVPMLQIGTLSHRLTIKSMQRFAREVMPRLRNHVSAIHREAIAA